MVRVILSVLILISFSQCQDDLGGVPCDSTYTTRIGARCVDGTLSRSTGSGTCSSHKGVDYWICRD
jgi:hypothetical protein